MSGADVSATYAWTPNAGLTAANTLTPTVTNPVANKTYTVTATTVGGGCISSDTATLIVIAPPLPCLDPEKGFTPNWDGVNDYWKVWNNSGCDIINVEAIVYNRWGAVVYHSLNYNNDWDGKYKGNTLPDATYYYVIKVTDSQGFVQTLTGNVTILR